MAEPAEPRTDLDPIDLRSPLRNAPPARDTPDLNPPHPDAPAQDTADPDAPQLGTPDQDAPPPDTPHLDTPTQDTLDLDAPDLSALRRRTSVKWRMYPPDVLPTFVAEMDYPVAAPIRQVLHRMVEAGDLGYASVDCGYQRLPEAFAGWAATALGWQPDPAQVLVLPDVMVGVELALQVSTAPGDGVVVNTPVYPPFLSAVAESGRTLVEHRLTLDGKDWVFDLDELGRLFAAGARAYLLCNPHNPTGRVATPQELARVLALAAEHDVLVVADEVHAPLVLPGARHTVAATLPEADGVRLLTVTSASKAWNIAGLRCAVAVPSAGVLGDALHGLPARARMGASVLGIEASAVAFERGEPWLAAVRAHLDRNRWLLADLVAARLPGVGYLPPQATYLAWLDCRQLGLADPAQTFLDAGRVAVGDGTAFGPPGAGFARVGFATSAAILTETVDRMAAAVAAAR
jgi:cysteine-S-conjugate beta-lyase